MAKYRPLDNPRRIQRRKDLKASKNDRLFHERFSDLTLIERIRYAYRRWWLLEYPWDVLDAIDGTQSGEFKSWPPLAIHLPPPPVPPPPLRPSGARRYGASGVL